MDLRRTCIGVVAAGLCCVCGDAGALAATPAGGTIQIIVKPGLGQGDGQILVTGAIGDYGTSHRVARGGKTYANVTLRKGTIKFDLTELVAKTNSVGPRFDSRTCSAWFSLAAPVPIVSGTGLYKTISGSANLTEAFGFLVPRYRSGAKKGRCNLSNRAVPVAQLGTVYGTGTVTF